MLTNVLLVAVVAVLLALWCCFVITCQRHAREPYRPRFDEVVAPKNRKISSSRPSLSAWTGGSLGCFPSGRQTERRAQVLAGDHTFEDCWQRARALKKPFFGLRNGRRCLLFDSRADVARDGGASPSASASCPQWQTTSGRAVVMAGGANHHTAYDTVKVSQQLQSWM